MNTNIYRCVNENDLNEILNDNSHTLVTIMYATKQSDLQNKLKKCLINLASEYNNCMFVYIDVETYVGTEHVITQTITSLPTTFMYLNNNSLAVIEGNCVMTIKKAYTDVIQLVSKKINLSRDVTSVKINDDMTKNIDDDKNGNDNNSNEIQNNIDKNQMILDEKQHNSDTLKIKKVKKIQQMLSIKQLERLKKLKELEERAEN
jgi:hypothetical protein